jgi:hypothetical protein
VQFKPIFHLTLSELRSDRYSLSGCEISVDFNRNSRVLDSDSTNIGRIANLKAGGERAAKTAQSAYTSCHGTIRTQILNWSETSGLAKAGF